MKKVESRIAKKVESRIAKRIADFDALIWAVADAPELVPNYASKIRALLARRAELQQILGRGKDG